MSEVRSSARVSAPVLVVGLLVIALATVLAGYLWRRVAGERDARAVSVDFRLATLDGRRLGPADFDGQVVLVDFWATWCGPCHIQRQILEPLYRDFQGRGVAFLAVSLGEDPETVAEFVRDNPYSYPVLVDPEDSLTVELEIYALPTVLVIDRRGKVAFFEPGLADGETLRRILHQALRA
jgi:thiol-disulfide isomerase/thioredoxin